MPKWQTRRSALSLPQNLRAAPELNSGAVPCFSSVPFCLQPEVSGAGGYDTNQKFVKSLDEWYTDNPKRS